MRRDFRLPEEDEAHLDARGLAWETIREGGLRWLLLHGFPVPSGYNHAAVIAAIRIEGGYPPGKLDMVYLYPHLARADGRTIGALTEQDLDGKKFQRWSRHYTWRDGVDDLCSHIACVEAWLRDELRKGR